MDRNSQGISRGCPVTTMEAAKATDLFDHFIGATTLKMILGTYRAIIELLHLKPNIYPHFYPKLRNNLNSWKAKAVWKKIDSRAAHKCYNRGKACSNTRVLIIGAGPCGLRTAIEAQLLGAKVVVVEKRDRISRNNVLHLWPFVIEDLRALGAKKFFGKFCAGAIDHISIRQLQCILLKVALLLGVELHTEVSFEGLIEPDISEKLGWRAKFKPSNHPVSQYEFDVIVGADGKRNTLQGFNRKEFRGKLAIAITANFINKRTEAEARVQEISGVAFIFNQKFFKDLNAETRIDLENIVYYKDDTHYFVMTAKKSSLLDKGVIIQDYADTERLLSPDNIERNKLMNYAKEAADFSTNYQMPNLEFAVNHYGQPDVAMFDFTSMYAAENASKVLERHGHKLLMILVGDSLLEPFWPTGSGCARGFLSALDACWAIKGWGSGLMIPLEVLSERESIYRLLAQTTPENLNKDWKSYTLDPATRYPTLNKAALLPQQVVTLYDTDDVNTIELTSRRLDTGNVVDHPRKRRNRDVQVDQNTLLNWVKEQVREHTDLQIDDITTSFQDGRVLCAILNYYRPDLLDYGTISKENAVKNNQLVFDLLEKEIGIPPVMTGEEMVQADVPDYLTMFSYLTQIYEVFRVEIPHIKHAKLVETKEMKRVKNRCSSHISIKNSNLVNPEPVLDNIKNACKANTWLSKKSPNDHKKLQKTLSNNLWKARSRYENDDLETVYFPNRFNYDSTLISEPKSNKQPLPENEGVKSGIMRRSTFHQRITKNTPIPCIIAHEKKMQTRENRKYSLLKKCKLYNYPKIRNETQNEIKVKTDSKNNFSQEVHKNNDFMYTDTILNNLKSTDVTHDKSEKYSDMKMCGENSDILVMHVENNGEPFKTDLYFRYTPKMCNACGVLNASQRRVVEWLTMNDYRETNMRNEVTKLVSQTRIELEPKLLYNKELEQPLKIPIEITVEKRTDVVDCNHSVNQKIKSEANHSKHLKSISTIASEAQVNEPFELPDLKENVGDFSKFPFRRKVDVVAITNQNHQKAMVANSSRPKRHVEFSSNKMSLNESKKSKKRRSLESHGANLEERMKRLEEISANRVDRHNKRREQRKLQTQQFIKSMQMLQTNAKPDHSEPFEDYSIFVYRQTAPLFQDRVKDLEKKFTYVPHHENRVTHQPRSGAEGEFVARIKGLQDKWKEPVSIDKKPKDLIRAIGKIENSDWNIKEIEKKILENKMGKSFNKEREKVPKWNREQFLARHSKMESKQYNRQDSAEAKFSELDKGIRRLEQKLKEGTIRELGSNKIATITEKLIPKPPEKQTSILKTCAKSYTAIPSQGGSEYCHFCQKRVYLMERLSAEGKFFHRGCFKCQYCHTTLRLGSYLFDKDSHRFYCSQHFGMTGELRVIQMNRREVAKTADTLQTDDKHYLSPSDRVRTPERIEFSNLSVGNLSSELDESLSQMDEDEWTDKNFGVSAVEPCSSEEESCSFSGSESDNEEGNEEALEEPPTREGTMKWMDRCKQRYSKDHTLDETDSEEEASSSNPSSYYENSSEDEEEESATEGEDDIRARELRKQEVQVEPPIAQTDTGSDTEIVSDESSTESSRRNSVTEVSTDSEFALDDALAKEKMPLYAKVHNVECTSNRVRNSSNYMGKVQLASGVLQAPVGDKHMTVNQDPQLNVSPSTTTPAQSQVAKSPNLLLGRTEGYALNRTQSTGGIATKVSLELKKKYLFGDTNAANIQKSGSVSTLDSKFKSFHTNISDCQKLLKLSPNASPSADMFRNKLDLDKTSLSPVSMSSFLNSELPTTSAVASSTIIEQLPDSKVNEPDGVGNLQLQANFTEHLDVKEAETQDTPVQIPEHWNDKDREDLDISSDSLTCDSDSATSEALNSTSKRIFSTIPRVEIRNDEGEIVQPDDDFPPDSLCVEQQQLDTKIPIVPNEVCKSTDSEKKALNQPKKLSGMKSDLDLSDIHKELHGGVHKLNRSINDNNSSEHDSITEQGAGAMTETEQSDWAHDSAVSDDFDVFEPDHSHKNEKFLKSALSNSEIEFNGKQHGLHSNIVSEGNYKDHQNDGNSFGLSDNYLSNIEFMDTTVEEGHSDETALVEALNQPKALCEANCDDYDYAFEDSLNPNINDVVETINSQIVQSVKHTTNEMSKRSDAMLKPLVEIIPQQLADYEENISTIKTMEKLENKAITADSNCNLGEKDNNIASKVVDQQEAHVKPNRDDKLLARLQLDQKLLQNKIDKFLISNEKSRNLNKENIGISNLGQYAHDQHCERLQSKVDLNNAQDSIDVTQRKYKEQIGVPANSTKLEKSDTCSTLEIKQQFPVYTKECIKKERDENQKLVQEIVMNKMRSQNKTLERKKRNRNCFITSLSPQNSFQLSKSATINLSPSSKSINSNDEGSCATSTPSNIYSSRNTSVINSNESNYNNNRGFEYQNANEALSPIFASFGLEGNDKIVVASVSDVSSSRGGGIVVSDLRTPIREKCNIEEMRKTAEKMKQDARLKARLKSNNDLGLSPEDKLKEFRGKLFRRNNEDNRTLDNVESVLAKTKPVNAASRSRDTAKRNSLKRSITINANTNYWFNRENKHVPSTDTTNLNKFRTKSVTQLSGDENVTVQTRQFEKQMCKSDSNLLSNENHKNKASENQDRRKSFTKMLSDFFGARKNNSRASTSLLPSKGFFSKLSPTKAKDKSKENKLMKQRSLCEIVPRERKSVSPPPIPPLPLDYIESQQLLQGVNSDEENYDHSESKGIRSGKSCRQAQLKRHRMAQEIQRKLDEIEVKTKQLEQRGVTVEKLLRGEPTEADSHIEETDLLKEWFNLMREITELRRYEKQLTVRARELELEDRHARLQKELRERLDSDNHKTKEDVKVESTIINEMMDIVAKRDSLILVLEEDRLRYSVEDRDFEEQMLAKGLKLTSLHKDLKA